MSSGSHRLKLSPSDPGRGSLATRRKRRRPDPWSLVWGQPYIDATTLAGALQAEVRNNPDPDFRTRLLIRDAVRGLRSYWGGRKFARWLSRSGVGAALEGIIGQPLGKPGFRGIRRRLVDRIHLRELKQILEIVGGAIHGTMEINIAGSIPTLVQGLTARPTDAIDVVDEVPVELRKQRKVLDRIKKEFGLSFAHVQSHYLPSGWRSRRHSLGVFGGIRAYLVDAYDIFLSKLSSKCAKHQQDLRVLARSLDPQTARARLFRDGGAFLHAPELRPQIEENWRFVFQEPLFPSAPPRRQRQAGPPRARGPRRRKRKD